MKNMAALAESLTMGYANPNQITEGEYTWITSLLLILMR